MLIVSWNYILLNSEGKFDMMTSLTWMWGIETVSASAYPKTIIENKRSLIREGVMAFPYIERMTV